MHCKIAKFPRAHAILLSLLILNGCATTPVPWTTIIEDDRKEAIEQSYRQFANTQNNCSSGWDADVIAKWHTSVLNYTFPGYLQTLPPAHFKLVIANPLGQPLKLLSTDGINYQYIDVSDRSSIAGSVRSWAIRYELPYTLVNRSWPDWLQGRPDGGKQRLITEIREDSEVRGAWLTIADIGAEEALVKEKNNSETDSEIKYLIYEYLLVDPESGIVKEQIIVDELEKPQATVVYNRWEQTGSCLYPVDIELTGLRYGASIHLQFSQIQQAELTPDDFEITVPPGFSRVMMP